MIGHAARLLAIYLLTAAALHAQTAPGMISDSTVRALQTEFARRPRIRVLTKWGPFDLAEPEVTATSIGYHRLLSDTSYLPDSVTVPQPMPMTWIEAIQVPHHKPLKWGLIGGLPFAAMGWLIGTVDKSNKDLPGCTTCSVRTGLTPATGTLLFGSLGAVLGAVSSLLHSEWTHVYGAP